MAKGSIIRPPRISQEIPRYNPYINISQNMQFSTMQPHRTQNLEDFFEEPEWLSDKLINDITNFDYPSNS